MDENEFIDGDDEVCETCGEEWCTCEDPDSIMEP